MRDPEDMPNWYWALLAAGTLAVVAVVAWSGVAG